MAHYNEVRPHSSLGYKTPSGFFEELAPKGKSAEAGVKWQSLEETGQDSL
jgi:hypothetical protein